MQSNLELTLRVTMKHLMLKRAEKARQDWDIQCCIAETVLLPFVNSPDPVCHPVAFLWSVCPVTCPAFQLSLLKEGLVFDVLLVSGTWCLGGEREPRIILGLQSATRLVYTPTAWAHLQYMVGSTRFWLQILQYS